MRKHAPRAKTRLAGKENRDPIHCMWADADDAILVRVLKEQKDAGNQSGAGWKKQVWTAVASALEADGIKCGGPKTAPKCSDHFQTLKANFREVDDIRHASGFGWDDGTKTCVASESVWADYLARHRGMARWKTTPFPLYHEMQYLVDGIVATGAGAFHPGNSPAPSPAPSDSSKRSATEAPGEADTQDTSEEAPAAVTHTSATSSFTTNGLLSDELASEITNDTETKASRSRKRTRAESESPLPDRRHKWHQTGHCHRRNAESIDDVADAVFALSTSMNTGPSTPARRASAIKLVIADGEFSDNDESEIMVLFSEDIAVADTYAGIEKKSLRTGFLRKKLAKREF